MVLFLQGDHLLDNQVGHTAADIGYLHKQCAGALLVCTDQDGRRVAAAAALTQRRVDRAVVHHVRRQVFVQVIAVVDQVGKGRILAAGRVVLIFTGKVMGADSGALDHQIEDAACRPRGLRPGLHLGLMGAVKCHRLIAAVGFPEDFPLFPQIHAFRPRFDGLKDSAVPKLIAQGLCQYAVVMQDGADVDDVVLLAGTAQRRDGLLQPRQQLLALLGVLHLLVVFNIVEDAQVWTVWAVHHPAQAFAATGHLHFDVVGGHNCAGLPHPPLPGNCGEIGSNTRVERQLGLDGFQHRESLVDAVHHDDRKFGLPGNDAPQGIEPGHDGRFGFAARRGNSLRATLRVGCHCRQQLE